MAEKKQGAGPIASTVGVVGGASIGYDAAKGAKRAKLGAKNTKNAYKFSYGLGTSRLKALGTATKTGFTSAVRAPKAFPGRAGLAAGAAGAVAGGIAADKYADRKRIKKNDTISAFGVDHA